MIEGYDSFKDGAPGAVGLSVKRQTMRWVLPFTGLREALKEAGNWNDADQAHNDGLIKRQGVSGRGLGRLQQVQRGHRSTHAGVDRWGGLDLL